MCAPAFHFFQKGRAVGEQGLNHWLLAAPVARPQISTVSGKKPSNKIWPVIFAMAIVVIAIWVFTVLLHP
jgi:hypothetical protein